MIADSSQDADQWNCLANQVKSLLKTALCNERYVALDVDAAGADRLARSHPTFLDDKDVGYRPMVTPKDGLA